MDLESFREYCLTKKDATEGMPFGETVVVFKVARQNVRAGRAR